MSLVPSTGKAVTGSTGFRLDGNEGPINININLRVQQPAPQPSMNVGREIRSLADALVQSNVTAFQVLRDQIQLEMLKLQRIGQVVHPPVASPIPVVTVQPSPDSRQSFATTTTHTPTPGSPGQARAVISRSPSITSSPRSDVSPRSEPSSHERLSPDGISPKHSDDSRPVSPAGSMTAEDLNEAREQYFTSMMDQLSEGGSDDDSEFETSSMLGFYSAMGVTAIPSVSDRRPSLDPNVVAGLASRMWRKSQQDLPPSHVRDGGPQIFEGAEEQASSKMQAVLPPRIQELRGMNPRAKPRAPRISEKPINEVVTAVIPRGISPRSVDSEQDSTPMSRPSPRQELSKIPPATKMKTPTRTSGESERGRGERGRGIERGRGRSKVTPKPSTRPSSNDTKANSRPKGKSTDKVDVGEDGRRASVAYSEDFDSEGHPSTRRKSTYSDDFEASDGQPSSRIPTSRLPSAKKSNRSMYSDDFEHSDSHHEDKTQRSGYSDDFDDGHVGSDDDGHAGNDDEKDESDVDALFDQIVQDEPMFPTINEPVYAPQEQAPSSPVVLPRVEYDSENDSEEEEEEVWM